MDLIEFKNLVNDTIITQISYDCLRRGRIVNPTKLLDKFEFKYPDIRPKDHSTSIRDGKVVIRYSSQGCDNFTAMKDMLTEALKSVKHEYPIVIKLGSRDMSLNEYKEFDI